VLWADFTPTPASSHRPTAPFLGTLSWEVATSFPIVTQSVIKSPEDPLPAWNLQPTIDWFPSFLYFNIYAQPFSDKWNVGTVDKAVWIGTSGLDGQCQGFYVLPENLPFEMNNNNPATTTTTSTTKIRFYIQGVKDCGEVLKWQKCAYVDVSS
jgi:mannosyl-glycoprotein endo-beta-N-acetylglucosaminidase